MSKEILGTETFKKGEYRVGLILNENLEKLFSQVARECLPFKEGLSDKGSCCLGMGLEVVIYESKRNKPTTYRLIKQVWQGSLGNEEYFRKSLEYIKLTYPDLYPFCSINYGRMD